MAEIEKKETYILTLSSDELKDLRNTLGKLSGSYPLFEKIRTIVDKV